MKAESEGIERILTEKKELVRLFLLATVLAFSISGLAGLFISQTIIPKWSLAALLSLLLILSLAFLCKDLLASLEFEETASALVFFNSPTNSVVAVKAYRFAEQLQRTLGAVRAESKSIYSEWEKDPLKRPFTPSKGVSPDGGKPRYVAVVKAHLDRQAHPLPKSARLLEEAATFILIEELSLHLSEYFNNADQDSPLKEYSREDIPAFVLRNRVLNLLSTPIEQRDIF